MARNKYPEVTVEKILDVSQKLFLEKGYDNTTIPDIVEHLGGLTKGAVYHHFKSKEDIMDALGDRMFFENNPFTLIVQRKDLNGLEKLKEMCKVTLGDSEQAELNKQGIPILKNPRILVHNIEMNRIHVAPMLERVIQEGNQDGSIHTQYSKEVAEVMQLFNGLWLTPSIFPGTKEELHRRLDFIKLVLDTAGIPVFDEEIMEMGRQLLTDIAVEK